MSRWAGKLLAKTDTQERSKTCPCVCISYWERCSTQRKASINNSRQLSDIIKQVVKGNPNKSRKSLNIEDPQEVPFSRGLKNVLKLVKEDKICSFVTKTLPMMHLSYSQCCVPQSLSGFSSWLSAPEPLQYLGRQWVEIVMVTTVEYPFVFTSLFCSSQARKMNTKSLE